MLISPLLRNAIVRKKTQIIEHPQLYLKTPERPFSHSGVSNYDLHPDFLSL